jgi:FkbM family methyltransferase
MNYRIAEYASLGYGPLDKAALALFRVASLAAQSRQYRRLSGLASSFPMMWLKPKELRGLQLLVDPTDWSQTIIFDEIFLRSGYDLNKIDFIPDVIVDCGAHIGMFSLLAASRFPEVTLVAYEPNPKNVGLVRKQAQRNSLTVDIHEAAVSIASTTMKFAAITANSNGGRLIHDVPPEIEGSQIETLVVEVVDFKDELRRLKPKR